MERARASWFSGAPLVVSGSALAALCGLLFVAMTGRMLAPERFADFVVLSAALTFAVTAGAPYNVAVSQLSAEASATGRPERIRAAVSAATRQLLLFAVPVVVMVIVLARPLAHFLHLTEPAALSVAAATLLLTLLVGIRRAALRGAQQFVPHTGVLLVDGAVRLACGVALIAFAGTAAAAIGGYSAGALVALAALTLMQRRKTTAPTTRITPAELHVIAGPAALLVMFLGGFQNLDVLLVKRFIAPADAAAYGAAASLARMMSVVAIPFETLLVSGAIHARHAESSDFAPGRLITAWVAVVGIALAGFALAPHQILGVLFGRKYSAAAPLLLPLGAAMAFLFFSYILGQILISYANTSFLFATGAAFVLEVAGLLRFHASPARMASVVFWSQAILLAALLLIFGRVREKSREVADGI